MLLFILAYYCLYIHIHIVCLSFIHCVCIYHIFITFIYFYIYCFYIIFYVTTLTDCTVAVKKVQVCKPAQSKTRIRLQPRASVMIELDFVYISDRTTAMINKKQQATNETTNLSIGRFKKWSFIASLSFSWHYTEKSQSHNSFSWLSGL